MEAFQTIPPSPLLAPYVKQYWFLKSVSAGHVQRIIPTGYVSLFIHRANPLFSVDEEEVQPQMYITGQSTGFSNLLLTRTLDLICIDFLPYGARFFFDISMIELKEQVVALDLLSDPRVVELGNRLTDTFDNLICVSLIEQFLTTRFFSSKEYNFKRMAASVMAINRGEGDVSKLAGISCLSYKQFNRVFSEYVGINPKTFLQIVRFQKALYVLQVHPAINFTQLAFECGYYDQPHLIKEFKSFSGYTPSEYISICLPYSDYFS